MKVEVSIPFMYFVYIFLGNVVAWPLTAFFNNFLKLPRFLVMIFGIALGLVIALGFEMSQTAIFALWPLYLIFGFFFALRSHRSLTTLGREGADELGNMATSMAWGLLFGLLVVAFVIL